MSRAGICSASSLPPIPLVCVYCCVGVTPRKPRGFPSFLQEGELVRLGLGPSPPAQPAPWLG